MPSSVQDRRLEILTERLTVRFPAISTSTISTVVREVHHGFDGHPVREFIPILVERAAARTLISAVR